jgi:hypothetical protein
MAWFIAQGNSAPTTDIDLEHCHAAETPLDQAVNKA